MTELRPEQILAESRRAIQVLTRLTAQLEVFTDQIENELARRESEGGDDDRRPSD